MVSIPIIGYGARVALPKEVLYLLQNFSPTMAHFLVDFFYYAITGAKILPRIVIVVLLSRSAKVDARAHHYV